MNTSEPLAPRALLFRRPRPRRTARDGHARDPTRKWRRYAWLTLAVSCATYLLLSLSHDQAFHPFGRLNFFDLRVYRGAAQLTLSGQPLYGGPIWHWAPFTYPPFAAVMFAPLALLPLALDEVLVTSFGVIALFVVLARALRLPTADDEQAVPTPPWRPVLIPVTVAAALWLEPVTATLGYGQINFLIALLIVGDLSRPDSAKSKGALIGRPQGSS